MKHRDQKTLLESPPLYKIHKNLVKLLSLASLSFAVGCATSPLPNEYKDVQKGRWEAKALVRSTSKAKSNIVLLDIIAIKPDKMRLEVHSTMGIHVASLAMNSNEAQLLLPTKKQFYSGSADASLLQPILGVSLDPKLLLKVLFRENIDLPDWKCEKNKKDFLSKCQNIAKQESVSWQDGSEGTSLVRVSSKSYDIQIQLKSFSTKVQESEQLFKLTVPNGYKSSRTR